MWAFCFVPAWCQLHVLSAPVVEGHSDADFHLVSFRKRDELILLDKTQELLSHRCSQVPPSVRAGVNHLLQIEYQTALAMQ